MRLIWNAGAAIAVTGLLTIGASFAAGTTNAAGARPAPGVAASTQSASIQAASVRSASIQSDSVQSGPVRTTMVSDVAQAADLDPGAEPRTPHRHYTGLAEHFEAANTAHDGKLTLDQARQAGWKRVVKHFDDIDTAHAGFVTASQIHAYNIAHRHARKAPGSA